MCVREPPYRTCSFSWVYLVQVLFVLLFKLIQSFIVGGTASLEFQIIHLMCCMFSTTQSNLFQQEILHIFIVRGAVVSPIDKNSFCDDELVWFVSLCTEELPAHRHRPQHTQTNFAVNKRSFKYIYSGHLLKKIKICGQPSLNFIRSPLV